MKVKNIILQRLLLLLVLLSLLLCSCSNGISISVELGEADAEADDIVLNITSMYGSTDTFADTYRELIEEFMDENEGVVVRDDSSIASEEWKEKIAQDFAVGDEADVVGFFTDANAENVLAADKFVPIEEIRREYPDYASETRSDALRQAAAPNGVMYAVPTVGYWEGMYCNKDLFDKYGLELPSTWDSLLTAIEKLNDEGITPIAISLGERPHYLLEFLMLFCSGKEIYESIPSEAPDEWIKGVELMKTLYDMGAFPENCEYISYNDARDMFVGKKAAMIVDGSWLLGTITDQENTVLCDFPIPPGGNGWYRTILYGYSSGFYITRKAWNDPEKREYAVKLVMKLTERSAVQKFWEAGGCVQATAIELDMPDDMTPLAKSAREYVQRSNLKCSPTDSRIAGKAWAEFMSDISGVATGAKSARDCINKMLDTYVKQHAQ